MIGIRSRSPYLVLVAGVAFFAVLLLLLLVSGGARAEGDAEAPSVAARGSEVWSASMRVGSSRGLTGYSTISDRTVGALSTDAFAWRDTSYRVTNILYNRSRGDAEAWNVLIDFTPALPEGIECLALQLGDSWLNLADGRGNNRQFFWYGVELDWRVGVAVPVRLREFPQGFEARAIDGWGNNADQPDGNGRRDAAQTGGRQLCVRDECGAAARFAGRPLAQQSPVSAVRAGSTRLRQRTWSGSGVSSWTTTSA